MSHFDQSRSFAQHRVHWSLSQRAGSPDFSNREIDQVVDLTKCDSVLIRRLNAYWSQLPMQRGVPYRRDVDPAKIREVLAHIMIIELHDDQTSQMLRLKYRLVGTAISRAMGRDATGHWFEEIIENDGRREQLIEHFSVLRQQRQPIFGQSLNTQERHGCHNFRWAIFPLHDGDGKVSHALMLEDYDNILLSSAVKLTRSHSIAV